MATNAVSLPHSLCASLSVGLPTQRNYNSITIESSCFNFFNGHVETYPHTPAYNVYPQTHEHTCTYVTYTHVTTAIKKMGTGGLGCFVEIGHSYHHSRQAPCLYLIKERESNMARKTSHRQPRESTVPPPISLSGYWTMSTFSFLVLQTWRFNVPSTCSRGRKEKAVRNQCRAIPWLSATDQSTDSSFIRNSPSIRPCENLPKSEEIWQGKRPLALEI